MEKSVGSSIFSAGAKNFWPDRETFSRSDSSIEVQLAMRLFLARPITKTFNIAQAAKLGKADLKAGEYRLQIDGNKATVQKGKLVVAESEGRWEDRSSKSAYDSVLIGEGGQVKEVRFAGQTRVFVFNE